MTLEEKKELKNKIEFEKIDFEMKNPTGYKRIYPATDQN